MQVGIENIVDTVSELNGKALEAAKAVAEINKRTVDKIAQQQLALVGEALEGGAKQLKLLQETKDYKEYFAAQAEFAKEGTEKVLAAARDTLSVLTSARDEFNALVEQGATAAASQATAAGKTAATKKAANEA